MSNCINFVGQGQQGEKVPFSQDELDIPKFQALLASSKEIDYKQSSWTDADLAANTAWWFLQTCSEVVELSTGRKAVVIEFGAGRSGHTIRDFQGTLQTLAPLMKRVKRYAFHVTDEFDGHRQVYRMPVEFKSGKVS